LNKADIGKFLNGTKAKVSKHSPAILIGLAIVSGGTAVVLAVKDTPKALKRIEDKKQEYQVDKLSPWETVKTTWPCYVPTAIAFTFAAGCAIGSQSIHVKRNAALAAAYKISETALLEYRDKVIETIGEKKEQTVRDKVAQEQVVKHPVDPQSIYRTGNGSSLFLDPLSKRYFESDIEVIRRAENRLNKKMLQSICGSTSLNDFYVEIGLEPVDESIGYTMGWNSEHQIDLDIRPAWTNDERTSCLVLGHYNPPKYDY
jgi:hypothetical protein